MRVLLQHGTRRMAMELDSSATMNDLQVALFRECHVPIAKQRLVFTGGKKAPSPDQLLVDHFQTDTVKCLLIGNAEVSATAQADGAAENADADLNHLVSRQHEANGGIYTCSYTHGHLLQDAFVCRTCARSGLADAQHVVCSSCADVCHAGHEVESWGRWIGMRCDCCTEKFTERHRCQFVVDERDTSNVPASQKMPPNPNRYPPDTESYCFCKAKSAKAIQQPLSPTRSSRNAPSFRSATTVEVDRPSTLGEAGDEPEDGNTGVDDYAQACVLCNQCFWDSHLSRLFTKQLRHVGCYGQVVKGDVVAYNCRTCSTWVCPSCCVRCHRDHDIDLETPTVPTRDDNPTAEFVFSCGCLGMCNITEGVPPEVILEEEDRDGDDYLPQSVALDLIDNDEFVNFVCGNCMQRYPWLMSERLDKCFNGILPEQTSAPKPVWCAGQEGTKPYGDETEYFAYHGMLVPEHCFVDYACQCEACAEMFEKLLPGCHSAREAAPVDLFVSTEERCTNCSVLITGTGYICTTCETMQSPSCYLCPDCYANRQTIHSPEHEFSGNDFDSLWNIFGASLLSQMDPALQQWMIDNWSAPETKDVFFEFIRHSGGKKRLRDGEDEEDPDAERSKGAPRK